MNLSAFFHSVSVKKGVRSIALFLLPTLSGSFSSSGNTGSGSS